MELPRLCTTSASKTTQCTNTHPEVCICIYACVCVYINAPSGVCDSTYPTYSTYPTCLIYSTNSPNRLPRGLAGAHILPAHPLHGTGGSGLRGAGTDRRLHRHHGPPRPLLRHVRSLRRLHGGSVGEGPQLPPIHAGILHSQREER
jgi:hypothetical protein